MLSVMPHLTKNHDFAPPREADVRPPDGRLSGVLTIWLPEIASCFTPPERLLLM
jgi:hypothetical protein